jgi:hypothetical protein
MKKLALTSALALAILPLAGIAFTATSAQAVVDQTQAEQLVRASLANMGITNPDATLVQTMVDQILAAQTAGAIIDTTLLNPTTPTPAPTDTATPALTATGTATASPTPIPGEREHSGIGRHYREQSQLWAIASPLWNAAFDTIQTAYDACVTAAVPGVDCAATLIPDLQVAHATALTTAYDSIVATIAALPADQQAAAQAALDAQNAAAQKQLTHVLAEYTPTDAATGLVSTTSAKLLELKAELDRKSAFYRTTSPTGVPTDPAAAHRQDTEHRVDGTTRSEDVRNSTAAPSPATRSTQAAAPSATASAPRADRQDMAERLREQGNRR